MKVENQSNHIKMHKNLSEAKDSTSTIDSSFITIILSQQNPQQQNPQQQNFNNSLKQITVPQNQEEQIKATQDTQANPMQNQISLTDTSENATQQNLIFEEKASDSVYFNETTTSRDMEEKSAETSNSHVKLMQELQLIQNNKTQESPRSSIERSFTHLPNILNPKIELKELNPNTSQCLHTNETKSNTFKTLNEDPRSQSETLFTSLCNTVQTIIHQNASSLLNKFQHSDQAALPNNNGIDTTDEINGVHTEVISLSSNGNKLNEHQALIQIHPPMLGKILASLKIHGNTAEITLKSESQVAHALLQTDAPTLRHAMADANIHLQHLRIEHNQPEKNLPEYTSLTDSGHTDSKDKKSSHHDPDAQDPSQKINQTHLPEKEKKETTQDSETMINLWV